MWNDLRFTLRTLRRSPGFTLLAVLSLALGIGANTAIFSLLYQVVLRSLPVKDPAALVSLESNDYQVGWTRHDQNQTEFSYPMYRVLRDRNQVFRGLLARVSFASTLSYGDEAVRSTVEVVSGNFFEVLGVPPSEGRLLAPADDTPASQPAIVLGHAFWSTHLGADPKILNSRMLLNGQPVLVVGVAPRGFRGLLPGNDPDCYASLSMMRIISPGWDKSEQPDAYWLSLIGRLRPGINGPRAGATLLPLYRAAMADQIPRMHDVSEEARGKLLAKPIFVQPAAGGLNALREHWQTPLVVLTVMVAMVLLMACANVANLLIARATARQREIAIRLAVGATRGQLIRQLTVESAILAGTGGVLGLLLSSSLTAGLLSLLPADSTGGWLTPQLDASLLGYSLGLSLLTGLLFGLAPAWQVARSGLAPALKQQSAGMSASGAQSRMGQWLMMGQIAISLLLLIGAGLFTRSLLNLVRTDPGFRAEHLISFSIDPSQSGYSLERRTALFRELRGKLASLPGVESAAMAQFVPLGGWNWGSGVKAQDSPAAREKFIDCGENSLGAGYFHTLGIPLLAGRDFTENDDARAPKVAILNQTFARYLFGNADPLGRDLEFGETGVHVRVVGVVRDSRYADLREKPARFLYVPYEQTREEFTRQAAFFVRTRSGDRQAMSAIRAAMRQLDAKLPIDALQSMQTMLGERVYTDRLMATLAVAFGLLAAALAAVGLYGTVSYAVARRTREFAIRLVLGELPRSLLWSVMGDVGRLIAIGAAVGLPAAYWLGRLAESQFYGVRAHDAWALAGGVLLIAVVGVAAGLVPAIRAMRTEPVRALRYE
jgi:predicted permease